LYGRNYRERDDDAELNGSVSTVKAKKQITVTIPKNGGLVIVNK